MTRLLWAIAIAMLLLTACNNYGKKVSINTYSEVYYKGEGITEADAQRLGNFLLQAGYFDSSKETTVQLMRDKDAYLVKMVIDEEEVAKDKDFYQRFFWFMQEPIAQNVFGGNTTKIVLADEDLKELEPVGDIAKVVVNSKNRVLYNPDGVTETDAKNLGVFLEESGYFNGTKEVDILLHKTNGAYTVRFLVDEAALNEDKDQFVSLFKIYKYFIGQGVFNGQKTHAVLTSLELKDLEPLADLTDEEKAAVEEQGQASASKGNGMNVLSAAAAEVPEL
jgi:hypothetical protein